MALWGSGVRFPSAPLTRCLFFCGVCMKTGDKGDIAESLAISEFVKRGFKVAIPFGDYRYDLIVEAKCGEFKRVQVKYIGRATARSTINIVLHSITRKGRVRYSSHEVDYIVAYYEPEKSFYIIPYQDVGSKSAVNLRLCASRNNQQTGIIPASRYRERWDLIV